MATKKEWKSGGLEKLPVLNLNEKIGQVTEFVYHSTRKFTAKKTGDEYTVHKVTHEGELKEVFGSGLLNWFISKYCTDGTEVKATYKGLEKPDKKPGRTNRHQYELFYV